MQQTFQCYHCGGYNHVGQVYCTWCGNRFYYNCPHCSAWVDNAYTVCPNCHRELHWSANSAKPLKNNAPAILVSLLSSVLLIIIAFILLENNSGQIRQAPYQSGATPAFAIQPSSSPALAVTPFSNNQNVQADYTRQVDITSDTIVTIPVNENLDIPVTTTLSNTVSSSSSSSYNPAADAYLQKAFPEWGRCSGGSCRSISQ